MQFGIGDPAVRGVEDMAHVGAECALIEFVSRPRVSDGQVRRDGVMPRSKRINLTHVKPRNVYQWSESSSQPAPWPS